MQTFEDYLSGKCQCHTNNSPEGFEKWLEMLDTQEVIDYAEMYSCKLQDKIEVLEGTVRFWKWIAVLTTVLFISTIIVK